jgi:hypothetical protein
MKPLIFVLCFLAAVTRLSAQTSAWQPSPGHTLDDFFNLTAIRVDWKSSEQVWRAAGRAFQSYVNRRNRKKEELPRRVLADFLLALTLPCIAVV